MTDSSIEIRKAAMDLLARREHSRHELIGKLSRRFDDDAGLRSAVDRLQEDGLQSDLRYAESFLRSRAGRGYGPVRIRMEMSQRGVADELIRQAFDACDIDWLASLRQVLVNKFGEDIPSDYRDKARRMRFLQYRGFSVDQIRDVVG